MNQQPDTTTSIIDDQELAQALAGVNNKPEPAKQEDEEEVQEEQEEQEVRQAAPLDLSSLTSRGNNTKKEETNVNNTNNEIEENMSSNIPQRSDLQSLKMAAVEELRPLVDKLNIPNDEKFDVYLLLIRSTDDESLLSPAHEIATQIEDESRRAMALLDIIKETDYLSNKQNNSNLPQDYNNQDDYAENINEVQQSQQTQPQQNVSTVTNEAFVNEAQQLNQQQYQQTQPQEVSQADQQSQVNNQNQQIQNQDEQIQQPQQAVQGPNNAFAEQQNVSTQNQEQNSDPAPTLN